MRFFNIDLHVSVIEDVATQLRALGHGVESHLMSGHCWALAKERASRGTSEGKDGKVGYGSINMETWEELFHDMPTLEKIKRWQKENPQLAAFDGFIATYPPAFALLYDAFPGHTILQIPVRYDLHFTEDPTAWRAFNARLVNAQDAGRLTVVANNLYDANYYNYFTGRPALHISNTCDYIDEHTPKWSPRGTDKLLAFGEHAGCRALAKSLHNVFFVRDVLDQYTHREIIRALGVVWIPYNCSVMSFFEHYWLNIPLFVPSQTLLFRLWKYEMALSQLSWHRTLGGGSNIGSMNTFTSDPHSVEGIRQWMRLYDFYNEDEFPHITYFDSWDDLETKIASAPFTSISESMAKHNLLRRKRNLDAWREILSRIVPVNGS